MQQGVAFGISAAGRFGLGQEGEDVDDVAIEAFGKRQHGVEIIGGDGEVPPGDDVVLQVVGGGVGVGRYIGRGGRFSLLQHAEHGHHFHDAADVDGEACHAACHLVAVGQSGTGEECLESLVELLLLAVGEMQGEESAHDDGLLLLFPFRAPSGESLFEVAVVAVELVLPLVYGGHVVEDLPGEEPVFGRGYQRFHLGGSTGQEHGKIRLLHFAVFAVGAAVVGEAVVVEGLAHGVAPVPVVRPYGGGDGIGLAFAYQPASVGVHQVLQDTRSRVVSRDEEHPVGRQHGHFRLCALLAQGVIPGLVAPVGYHVLFHLPAYIVVNRLYQQPYQREDALARHGQAHHEGLQAGRNHFPAVGTAHVASHAGTQHGDGSQQEHVALGTRGTARHDAFQQEGPVEVRVEGGQGCQRVAAFEGFFPFFRFVVPSRVRVCV